MTLKYLSYQIYNWLGLQGFFNSQRAMFVQDNVPYINYLAYPNLYRCSKVDLRLDKVIIL